MRARSSLLTVACRSWAVGLCEPAACRPVLERKGIADPSDQVRSLYTGTQRGPVIAKCPPFGERGVAKVEREVDLRAQLVARGVGEHLCGVHTRACRVVVGPALERAGDERLDVVWKGLDVGQVAEDREVIERGDVRAIRPGVAHVEPQLLPRFDVGLFGHEARRLAVRRVG